MENRLRLRKDLSPVTRNLSSPLIKICMYIYQNVNRQRMNGLVIYKVPFEILDGSWLRNKSLWTSLKIYGGDVGPFVASLPHIKHSERFYTFFKKLNLKNYSRIRNSTNLVLKIELIQIITIKSYENVT